MWYWAWDRVLCRFVRKWATKAYVAGLPHVLAGSLACTGSAPAIDRAGDGGQMHGPPPPVTEIYQPPGGGTAPYAPPGRPGTGYLPSGFVPAVLPPSGGPVSRVDLGPVLVPSPSGDIEAARPIEVASGGPPIDAPAMVLTFASMSLALVCTRRRRQRSP